jgi:hypothetical protein
MATKHLNKIFLSASVPDPARNEQFYGTADIIAIRDAVRALASVVIPKAHLIWGGHPAITPLIRYVFERINRDIKNHVTLYQSDFFREYFPEDNLLFENKVITEAKNDRKSSLKYMREKMLDNNFSAGIFIGGMEGVLDEFELFKMYNPGALIIPVASTGAAAKMIFNKLTEMNEINNMDKLLNDYAYMAIFKDVLSGIIN